jgi:hypothetical protein
MIAETAIAVAMAHASFEQKRAYQQYRLDSLRSQILPYAMSPMLVQPGYRKCSYCGSRARFFANCDACGAPDEP